jgi:hypothetical protein
MTTQDSENISTILTLESLQIEYENTMTLYQQAQTNYNSALNGVVSGTTSSNVVTSNGKRYVLVPSKIFWGTGAIQQKTVSTIDDCVALCSTDSKCTGATFDSSAKSCWTRSGNAGLVTGTTTQTAIVSELVNAANTLDALNLKLVDLLKKMNDINKTTTIRLQTTTNNNISTNDLLLGTRYKSLMADRENINNILKEYGEINVKNQDQSMYLYQNQSSYMLWSLLTIIFIIIVVKLVVFPNITFNWIRFFIWTIIVSSLLVLVSFLKLTYGFVLFSIVVAVILLIVLKVVPSP